MATIAVLGTLDTKGHEHAFVAGLIRERGHDPLLIDVGTGAEPQDTPDITRYDVARSAGLDFQVLLDKQDRGECVVAMSRAVPVLLAELALFSAIRQHAHVEVIDYDEAINSETFAKAAPTNSSNSSMSTHHENHYPHHSRLRHLNGFRQRSARDPCQFSKNPAPR